MNAKIHPTAVIEDGATVGAESAVWDHVHIRHDTHIGRQCIIGGKTDIAYGIRIGDCVKINSFVYVCHGVTIEDGVMVGAGTVFTNDRYPRAASTDLRRLRSSAPDERTMPTLVREGATIGAHATIGCDLVIGRFAMIGMGAVLTRSVGDFHLAVGHPARSVGCVCRCGCVLARFADGRAADAETLVCEDCRLRYALHHREVIELDPRPPGSHHA